MRKYHGEAHDNGYMMMSLMWPTMAVGGGNFSLSFLAFSCVIKRRLSRLAWSLAFAFGARIVHTTGPHGWAFFIPSTLALPAARNLLASSSRSLASISLLGKFGRLEGSQNKAWSWNRLMPLKLLDVPLDQLQEESQLVVMWWWKVLFLSHKPWERQAPRREKLIFHFITIFFLVCNEGERMEFFPKFETKKLRIVSLWPSHFWDIMALRSHTMIKCYHYD